MIIVVLVLWWVYPNTNYPLFAGGFFFLIIIIMVAFIAMEPARPKVIVAPPPPVAVPTPAPTVVVHSEHTAPAPVPVPQPAYYYEPEPEYSPPVSSGNTYQTFHIHAKGPQGQVYDDVRTEYSTDESTLEPAELFTAYQVVPPGYSTRPMGGPPNGTARITKQQIGRPRIDPDTYRETTITPPMQYRDSVVDNRGRRVGATITTPGAVRTREVNPPEYNTVILPTGQAPRPGQQSYRDSYGQYHVAISPTGR